MPKTKSVATISEMAFTPEQMDLITGTIARNATPDELKLFLYRCKNMGLDPLKPGMVHFIKYGNTPGTIVVGIEGFRAKAQTSKLLAGIKRGVLRDDKGNCLGAWAEVRRKDWSEPARAEVSLKEYSTGKAMWASKPETMIQKVAEAAALRMAFPDDLGGVYTDDEMQREIELNKYSIKPEQPAPGDGIQLEGFVMPAIAGPKLANKILETIPKATLEEWVIAAEKKYDGKDMAKVAPKTKNLYDTVVARIVQLENECMPAAPADEEQPGEFENFDK